MPHPAAWRPWYSSGPEDGRAPAATALVLAVADLAGLLRDGAPDPAPPQVSAREPHALPASTRPGRVRRCPPPVRETRMRSSTARNCGESPRCPAVITIDSGCAAARRPGAPCWPARRGTGPGRDRPARHRRRRAARPADPPFPGAGRRLVRPRNRGIHAHIPGDQPSHIRPARQPRSRSAARRHPAAIGRTAHTPTATDRTSPGHPATAHRCGPATGSLDQLLFRPPHRPARLLPPAAAAPAPPTATGQVSTAAHRYGRHQVPVKMVFLIDDSSPTGDLTASSA